MCDLDIRENKMKPFEMRMIRIKIGMPLYNQLPKMTQAMEMARKPCMHGTVSLPTFRSQITLKLVITENDNRSRHQTLSFFAMFIETSAKFSSELLLFMPWGMTMPMGKSFLLGTEVLNA